MEIIIKQNISKKNSIDYNIYIYIMPLTCKLSFEHFDFNDEEFLNDLKRVYHLYNKMLLF